MMADMVNGCFEILGGAFVTLNILRLHRDREVKGVSLAPVVFFTLWGVWNLYYYPSLGQWWSFWGGIGVVTANAIWIAQMWHYGRARRAVHRGDVKTQRT